MSLSTRTTGANALPADGDPLTDVLPGFTLAAAGLGMAFVTATTTAMAQVDPDRAGMVSGVINTAHEAWRGLGVALASTIAGGASVEPGPAAAQAATTGFDHAFLACAILAGLVAVAASWLLPAGRLPAGDGPVFAH